MKTITKIAAIFAAICLSACNSGLDHKLDTGNGAAAYKASLEAATKDMKPDEVEAFDSVVADVSLKELNELYPNATPRKIIHEQAKKFINLFGNLKVDFEKKIPEFDREAKSLSDGVKAVDGTFAVQKDFFGDQPTVRAKTINTSGITMTSLAWRVELYINESDKPVATTTISDNYKNVGGNKTGYEYKREWKLGFVSGDERFTTLEIQNASKRQVKLTLEVDDCIGLDGQPLGGRNPHRMIEKLEAGEAKAKKYLDI